MNAIKELSQNYNRHSNRVHLKDRISYAQKIANDFEWVKNKIDYYDGLTTDRYERRSKLKINYELYNGQYNEEDYAHLFKPFGFETDIRNSSFKHMDIMSEPLREIVGEEERRPFDPIVIAVNSDAVVRKREEKSRLIQQFIVQSADALIEQQLAEKESMSGTMPPEKREEAKKALTPPEIEEYMKKKFKLPEETQAQRLLNFLIKKENLRYKFNKGWKDVTIADREVYYVTTENGHPVVKLTNAVYFDSDNSDTVDFVQDGEWATYETNLLISEVYKQFGEFFTEKERKELDDYVDTNLMNLDKSGAPIDGVLIETSGELTHTNFFHKKIRVLHTVFKSLKKIKFITTQTDKGIEELIVDETYKFNPQMDLEERIAWIPEVWEGSKIGTDIYIKMRPLPNQYTNMSDPYNVKLPYYGAIYNKKNAKSVSLLDRAKTWNYMFDCAFYRLEEALGSDYGNVMIALQKSVPKNWSPEKWLSFLKATRIALIDPSQEGAALGSDPQYWKSINLSSGADIARYIDILVFCQDQCYKAIGTNPNRIGSAAATETVTNNQQKIIQSANITEPLFAVHNMIKEQVCTALIQEAKFAYRKNKEAVAYVLDDMSLTLLDLDTESLSLCELGCFVSNNVEDYNMIQELRRNAQALIQNSEGDLRLVATILKSKNPAALENVIEQQYQTMQENQAKQAEQTQALQTQMIEATEKQGHLQREHEVKLAVIKSMGYNNDSDVNKDMVPDVLQMHKFTQDFEIKQRELDIREKELVENNKSEAADREVEREKIKAQKSQKAKK